MQITFATKHASLFMIGTALGVSLYHASFGFTGGWRKFIQERQSASVRAQLLLFGICTLLFFPVLGEFFSDVAVQGAIAPVGAAMYAC